MSDALAPILDTDESSRRSGDGEETADAPRLSGLTIEGGAIAPDFDAETFSYAVTIGRDVSRLTVAPSVLNGAQLLFQPPDADDETEGYQVSLSDQRRDPASETTITIIVRSADGQKLESYQLLITRSSHNLDDASLSSLGLSGVEVSPAFDPDVTAFSAIVDTAQVTFTPVTNVAAATYDITPADVDIDTTGEQIPVKFGRNVVTITVTAADGSTTKTYTIILNRRPLALDASPLSLLPSGCTLHELGFESPSPWFTWTKECASLLKPRPDYRSQYLRVALPEDSELHLQMDADASNQVAIRLPTGELIASGSAPRTRPQGPAFNSRLTQKLPSGVYIIEAAPFYRHVFFRDFRLEHTATSIDGPALYAGTDFATKLMELTVDGIDIGSFKFKRLVYETNIGEDLATVTVRALPVSHSASVEFSHDDAELTTAAHEVTLEATGSTEITITVRNPYDSTDFTTYRVTLNKLPGTTHPLSSNAGLDSMSLGDDEVQPTIRISQYSYRASVDFAVEHVTLVAKPLDVESTYKIDPPDSDDSIPGDQIAVGPNGAVAHVVVTAEDGVTTRRYKLQIRRWDPRITMTLPEGCQLHHLGSESPSPEFTWTKECASVFIPRKKLSSDYFSRSQYLRLVLPEDSELHLQMDGETTNHIAIRLPTGELIASGSPPKYRNYHNIYNSQLTQKLPSGVYIIEATTAYSYVFYRDFRLEHTATSIDGRRCMPTPTSRPGSWNSRLTASILAPSSSSA